MTGDDYLGALLTDGPPAARCERLRSLPSDDFGPRVLARLRDTDEIVTLRGIAIADAAWKRTTPRLQKLAAVENDNAARLLAYGRHEGLAYFIHEHHRGPRLTSVLRKRGGTLSIDTLLPIFAQILHAVADAHRGGVVVGGIRPQDIRVVRVEDDELEVRLRNFGLAGVLGVPAGRGGDLDHPSIYRAPESDVSVSPVSDVFSLGVLFIRLLTSPLTRTDDEGQRSAELRARLRGALEDGALSNGLAVLISEAIELDRGMRPHDAVRLLERLQEVVPAARLRVDASVVEPMAVPTVVTDDSATHWPARQWTVLDAWDKPQPHRHTPVQPSAVLTESGTSIELPRVDRPVAKGGTLRVPPVPQRRSILGRAMRRVALGVGLLSTGSAAVAVAATVRPDSTEPATEARSEGVEAEVSAEVAPQPSTLLVETDRPGTLTVDGRVVGPTNEAIELGAGLHVLRVESDGHQVWRSRLRVEPGRAHEVRATLEPEVIADAGSRARRD
ncbi:MAG: PEGA domain-containing protein [Myxococcota bacterium]